ncbi:RelA-associated inhibitor, partial [Eschrichtius robustus]|nr:RelA-associated inhibitor [Eschrichtius robustus]
MGNLSPEDLTLRRRSPKAWNESDLDVAYEKKSSQTASYERPDVFARPASPGLQLLPWRESSLDGLGDTRKDNFTSATLPRNYKVFPLANDRRSDVDSYRRSLGSAGSSGTLPRSWQPVSRIPMPPSSPQPRSAPRQRPIPLSMIFKLQNAFWEHGASRAMLPGSPIFSRAPPPKLLLQPQLPPQSQPQLQLQALAPVPQPPQETWSPVSEGLPKPPTELEPEPELEGLLTSGLEAGDADEDAVTRPLSPTRLQPALPPEAQSVPELEEVARVLAEIPRPLKRRGSMEQSPIVALPPTHKKQYQQIINRLFHRHDRGTQLFKWLIPQDVEQSMGLMYNGVVYALWDYSAEFGDELSFRDGESVTVLRRDGPEETDWWWAALHGQEGYVPRNYFGLFPRVKPQKNKV